MPDFPSSTIIPNQVNKTALKERLRAFNVNSDGNKELLQVRLTLAELGLPQTDKDTEDRLIKWFCYQRPQLKQVCEERDVPVDGTIAEMRRALVWDLAEQGGLGIEASEVFVKEELVPEPKKKSKAKLAEMMPRRNTGDPNGEELAPKVSKMPKNTKAMLTEFARLAEMMLRFDSKGSDEEGPAPQVTKSTKKKLATLAKLMYHLDSEDSDEEDPTSKVTKRTKKVTNPTHRRSSEAEEDAKFTTSYQSLREDLPGRLQERTKVRSSKHGPQAFISSLQMELDALPGHARGD